MPRALVDHIRLYLYTMRLICIVYLLLVRVRLKTLRCSYFADIIVDVAVHGSLVWLGLLDPSSLLAVVLIALIRIVISITLFT